MSKKVKQIDITEALERTKRNEQVYLIAFSDDKPVIKNFNNTPVGKVLNTDNEYIFVVFEEGANEN